MINWTWPNPDEPQDGKTKNSYTKKKTNVLTLFTVDLIIRCNRLQELGVKKELEKLVDDSNKDVGQRAKTALEQLCSVIREVPDAEI